jgi:hypothetical protein
MESFCFVWLVDYSGCGLLHFSHANRKPTVKTTGGCMRTDFDGD